MDLSIILYSILILTLLGGIYGICLAVASHIFHVGIDPRIAEVHSSLPELNCGACGYPGCMKYAEAVVNDGVAPTLCAPGGSDAAEKIAETMGLTADSSKKRKVAFISCCGGEKAKKLFDYAGIQDCNAAVLIGNGPMACNYGCMSFYSCKKACKFGAIDINEEGLPVVNPKKCTGCMACIKTCPKDIIKMVPEDSVVFVQCNSKDRGKEVMNACGRGCIGCTKCVKECPVNAITMDGGLAVIDQDKCIKCGKCVSVCPVKVIHNYKS